MAGTMMTVSMQEYIKDYIISVCAYCHKVAACIKCVVGAIKQVCSCFSHHHILQLLLPLSLLPLFVERQKPRAYEDVKKNVQPKTKYKKKFCCCAICSNENVVWTSCGHINNNGPFFRCFVCTLDAFAITALSTKEATQKKV